MDISCLSGTRRCVRMGAQMVLQDTTVQLGMHLVGTQVRRRKDSPACIA